MEESPLSRRDFVKALGVVGVVLGERVLAHAAGGFPREPTPVSRTRSRPFHAPRNSTGEKVPTHHLVPLSYMA